MSKARPIPPDLEQCQTNRPNTWPHMPSMFTLGPVHYTRCENTPAWIVSDGEEEMTVCDECKPVMEEWFKRKPSTELAFRPIEA